MSKWNSLSLTNIILSFLRPFWRNANIHHIVVTSHFITYCNISSSSYQRKKSNKTDTLLLTLCMLQGINITCNTFTVVSIMKLKSWIFFIHHYTCSKTNVASLLVIEIVVTLEELRHVSLKLFCQHQSGLITCLIYS